MRRPGLAARLCPRASDSAGTCRRGRAVALAARPRTESQGICPRGNRGLLDSQPRWPRAGGVSRAGAPGPDPAELGLFGHRNVGRRLHGYAARRASGDLPGCRSAAVALDLMEGSQRRAILAGVAPPLPSTICVGRLARRLSRGGQRLAIRITDKVWLSAPEGAGRRSPKPYPSVPRASQRTPSERRDEALAIHAPSEEPRRASPAPGQATALQVAAGHPAAGIAEPRQARARPDSPPR